MSQQIKTVCDGDGCGAVKGDTNHWWTLVEHEKSVLTVGPFYLRSGGDEETQYRDFCGVACLGKAISKICGATHGA